MCFGGKGGDFVEDTRTILVNRDGALIGLEHPVFANDTLRITNLENFHEAEFRVTGQTRQEAGGISEWGVECKEKGRCLSDIDFPPPLDTQSTSAAALLECQGCEKQSLIVLSFTEINTLETSGTFERLCEQCGELSMWVYADTTRRPKDQVTSALPTVSSRVGKWDGDTEKRAVKRMALKLRVLVRNGKREEEVVKTENLSKKGLAICLKMTLSLGDFVTVICPYMGGGQEVEQRAEIRYRAPHVTGQNWFYGLRYVPT